MKKILAILAVASLLAAIPAQAANHIQSYEAGLAGDFVNICADESPTGENIAAACLKGSLPAATTVVVDDDVFGPVDFFWIWYDSQGNCVGESSDPTAACPNAGFGYGSLKLNKPAGAARLEILVSGPAFATLNSLDGTDGGFGTNTGTVNFIY